MKKSKRQSFGGACVLALGALASRCVAARAQGGLVGMVIALKGSPQLKSARGLGKLRLGARLASGEVVRCAGGSEATVVLFARGDRFLVRGDVTVSPSMKGALKLPATGAASRGVALALAGSRTGAVNMRGVGDEAATARSFGQFTPLDQAGLAGLAEGSRPELGFLRLGERVLSLRSDLSTNAAEGDAAQPAQLSYVMWTLFDSASNILYSARIAPQTGGQVRVAIPADVELSPRRAYVWRAVSYDNSLGRPQPQPRPSRWGLVTWLEARDATELSAQLPGTAPSAAADLVRADPERALLLAALLQQKGVAGGAWSLLSGLRSAQVPGAEDAFYAFYDGLPVMAQLFGAQIPSLLLWKQQQ